MKNRVGRLEEKSDGFRVGFPTQLDGNGNEFDDPPKSTEVRALRYSDGDHSVEYERFPDEEFDDFVKRAAALAMQELNVTLVLRHDVDWL